MLKMMSARRRPPVLLLLTLGLGVGLGAAALFSSPRVIDFSPSAGSEGAPGLAAISMTFSQDMQHQTVESRFRTDPARPGSFRWDGRRLTYLPSRAWPGGEQVRVFLAGGALSVRGLPMADLEWAFSVGAGRVAYLWPARGPADIYIKSPESMEAERLTQRPGGVSDFRLGPEGTSLVFTSPSDSGTEILEIGLEDGGTALLHRCPAGTSCSNASLSPDGSLLAFVQEEDRPGGIRRRQVMVAAVPAGSGYPVAGEDHATSQPSWSSQGWLALYDHTLAAYAVYDRVAEASARLAFVVPNELGEAAAWSPDGEHLVLAEIVFLPELPGASEEGPPRFFSHLKRVAAADGTQLDLSGETDLLVEDSGPAYAPDGSWIAFSRRSLDPASWSLGRQLWLMRPDGVDASPLTDAAELNHAGVAWSLDGGRMAYMVFDQLNPTDPARIWWAWADGREGGEVAIGGYAPRWIP